MEEYKSPYTKEEENEVNDYTRKIMDLEHMIGNLGIQQERLIEARQVVIDKALRREAKKNDK